MEDRTEEGVERPAAGLMLTEGDQQRGWGSGGPGMVSLVLIGLVGGLIGAGLVLVAGKGKRNSD